MRRLRHLSGQHRTAATNRLLGGLLAFNAGAITDIGIELGKMFYWNRTTSPPESRVRANRIKLRLFGTLLAMFVGGGLVGAMGFKYVGFVWVLPLAVVLLALSLPPLFLDLRRILRRRAQAVRPAP